MQSERTPCLADRHQDLLAVHFGRGEKTRDQLTGGAGKVRHPAERAPSSVVVGAQQLYFCSVCYEVKLSSVWAPCRCGVCPSHPVETLTSPTTHFSVFLLLAANSYSSRLHVFFSSSHSLPRPRPPFLAHADSLIRYFDGGELIEIHWLLF